MADKTEEQNFVSKLPEGRERFIAHVVEHGLEVGLRSPEDFIRHFPPAAIMMGLKDQPALRAQILVLTVGVKAKIATKKSAESAGEDLQIALDEGETDADSIVALFNPDDRVRYLPANKLWAYCVEPEFWKATAAKAQEFDRAKAHMAFMLERALLDKLITHRDIVEGISVDELSTRLPRGEIGKLLKKALDNAHKKVSFTEADLLSALPPAELVKHVPLAHIWESVVLPRVAQKHGYLPSATAEVQTAMEWLDSEDERKPGTAKAEKKPEPEKKPDAERKPEPDKKAEPDKWPWERKTDETKAQPEPETQPATPATPPSVEDDELGDVVITDDDIRIS